VIGLAQVYDLTPDESLRRRILEELRWGNRYFLSMQEPAGYVMNHVGGDALRHGDGIYNVSENVSEDWTPMVSYTIWLMALLQSS